MLLASLVKEQRKDNLEVNLAKEVIMKTSLSQEEASLA
jgi:hypothetical protein